MAAIRNRHGFSTNLLAIELGGIHSPIQGSINIQGFSNNRGINLIPGQKYPMHSFHAERNSTQSDLRMEIAAGCSQPTEVK